MQKLALRCPADVISRMHALLFLTGRCDYARLYSFKPPALYRQSKLRITYIMRVSVHCHKRISSKRPPSKIPFISYATNTLCNFTRPVVAN